MLEKCHKQFAAMSYEPIGPKKEIEAGEQAGEKEKFPP